MTGLKPAMLHRLQSPPSFGSNAPCTPLYPSTRLLAGPQPHSTHLQQDHGLRSLLSFSSSIGVISCSFLPGNCSKATFSKKFTQAPIWASPTSLSAAAVYGVSPSPSQSGTAYSFITCVFWNRSSMRTGSFAYLCTLFSLAPEVTCT